MQSVLTASAQWHFAADIKAKGNDWRRRKYYRKSSEISDTDKDTDTSKKQHPVLVILCLAILPVCQDSFQWQTLSYRLSYSHILLETQLKLVKLWVWTSLLMTQFMLYIKIKPNRAAWCQWWWCLDWLATYSPSWFFVPRESIWRYNIGQLVILTHIPYKNAYL